jgi:hypothetical protein
MHGSTTQLKRKRLWQAFAALSALFALAVPAGATEGGATIASAPVLVWGELQSGVGGRNVGANIEIGGRTFWRVPVRVGDRITGSGHVQTLNGCGTNRIELYGPEVTDANFWSSKRLSASGTLFQGSCSSRAFSWRWDDIPVTGLATIWAGISEEAPTFTFVAHVFHRTTVSIARLPQPVGSAVAVRARIHASTGTPTGTCAFLQRSDGGPWRHVSTVSTRDGACSARLANAARHTVRIRVQFVADGPWLPATAYTHLLSVR